MNILVAGGYDSSNPDHVARIQEFAPALATAIVEKGHVLLSGSRTKLDALVAAAAHEKLVELGDPDPDKRVISYVLAGNEPIHNHGTIIRSRLADWEIGSESFYIPETVREAHVVLLIGGFEGTYRAANWARIAKKPLLPLTAFGGAAAKIYDQELNDFAQKYAGLAERLEYEQLNSVTTNVAAHARSIISLAEKLAESKSVLVVMSYSDTPELVDAWDSFQMVASELGYSAHRVTEENANHRIVPEVLQRIERAAFTIVDLTELRPNVFYELGYAEGLRKRVIVTARRGTELPFDVKDIPTIFWDSQKKLRDELSARIRAVVKTGVGSAGAPLG